MRYLIYIVLVFGLLGCGTSIRDNWDENSQMRSSHTGGTTTTKPKFDFYLGASIGVSSNGEQTYHSGIYGRKSGGGDLVKFLDLDGKDNIIDSFAVDTKGNIYWTDRSVHGIFMADAFGKNRRLLLSGLDIPFGIAVDEAHGRVYWSNWLQSKDPQSGEVGYIDLSTGKVERIVTKGLKSAGHLRVDQRSNRLYIADLMGGRILSVGLDGGETDIVADINHVSQPGQMDMDPSGKYLFACDISEDKIVRIDLDTLVVHDIVTFVDAFANPEALAYSAKENKLYFVTNENGNPVLWRADIDGKNREKMTLALPNGVFAVQIP